MWRREWDAPFRTHVESRVSKGRAAWWRKEEEGRWSANGCNGDAEVDATRAAHPPGGRLGDGGDATGSSAERGWGRKECQQGHGHVDGRAGWFGGGSSPK